MTNRREFLGSGLVAGLTLTGFSPSSTDKVRTPQDESLPNARVKELIARFDLKYPIFQAPHLGAGPELVAAVSNAGGLGILGGLSRVAPEVAHEQVSATRKLTKRLFAVNYLLAVEPVSLPAALAAGAPIVHFSWGLPSKESVSILRNSGARFGVQVANSAGARAALELGADYLVCQGVEAGGHVQSSTAL